MESLKKNYEFRRTYGRGKSVCTHVLVAYARKNRLSKNRVGITVTTKVGGAVVRNLIRRRFREIYRLNEASILQGFDIVISARTKSRYVSYWDLNRAFVYSMTKLGLMPKDSKTQEGL